ncbi:3-hydroxyacyl-CoA dehydrogenase family protein [Paludifilum halophilum]|nr:3-hydroxyacyl-CoA dehydrogenase family protein [Paludifilum halophilum]
MADKVLLVGDGPLAEETAAFFREKKVEVWSLEQAREKAVPDIAAVIDGVSGPADWKKEGLRQAEALVFEQVPIFTSALYTCAAQAASWLNHPQRVAGFSPLCLREMKTVEISRPLQAEEDSGWTARLACWERWGKSVEVVGDEPGLVFPRTLALMVNESAYVLTEKAASAKDIDTAMKKGTNHPRGPLEWADRIGVDQVGWILKGLFEELGEDRYRPAPLIRKMIYANRLGRSTGRGFHRYR